MHKLIRVLFCCVLCMMALGPAEAARDSLVIGMRLEPPGLDPTTGAAEAIGEITLYNIFEGLTRIDQNGSVGPGLATAWQVSQDQLSYSFTLRSGVVFSDGTAFDSSDVKFSFERAASATSTNKRKAWFTNIAAIATPDPTTVTITLRDKNPAFLFNLGESPAVIMAPESAAGAATLPIGTGPYRLETWVKGDSVTLARNPAYRDPDAIRLSKVTFRFIDDSSAQITAMLSGDLDCFPFFDSPESVPLFAADPRFAVMEGTTEGETILAMNNKRPPLDDVRVRRAISLAIDRAALIEGAMFGRATPIGSHFAPHHPDYIDQTGVSPFDPERAKALLAEAGHAGGLALSLKLPPVNYARRSGEIIAAALQQVGISVTIEPLEWAQWLDVVYTQKNYDLSIVSHVEPLDIIIYANPDYYFQYDSAEFRGLLDAANAATDSAARHAALQAAQRKLADDAVNGFLFQLHRVGVCRTGVKGMWRNAPIFANDLAAMYWEE